jgi:uncharacterized membrane protein YeaQ/YmgE (transglycosylase-associated protein family)
VRLLELLLILGVAIPIGLVAHFTGTYSRKGWFLYIGLAFVGGFVGTWIARLFPVPTVYELTFQGISFPILWTLIGSVLIVAALGFIVKPGAR